jgi:putative ABC transport system ATP-binding protein
MEPAVIDVKNIHKHFFLGDQKLEVLKGLNLQVNKGEFVAFMGPSGSGKSTLMNVLGFLDTPSSGTYIFNGRNVSSLYDRDLAAIRNGEIGFVFQTFNLLPRLSSLDNVALPLVYAGVPKKERIERAKRVMEKVGLGDRTDHLPNQLSGGQRQRVAVARALINDPSVILADEPTGNLDSKTSREIMRLFQDINDAGNTLVVVTHEDDIAAHTKRVIRLRDGVLEKDELNENRILL